MIKRAPYFCKIIDNNGKFIEIFSPTKKKQYFVRFLKEESGPFKTKTGSSTYISPDFKSHYGKKVKWSGYEIADFFEKQNELPILIWDYEDGREFYFFQNFVYDIKGEIFESVDDLKALILAKELYWQKKIDRAKSITKEPQIVNNRSTIPDDIKIFVWRRDEGKCVKCGSQVNLEFDHIIPVSKGGSNTSRNIQILCEKCNREKGDNIV